MKNLYLFVFIGASLAALLPAKDRPVELSGFWILDPNKSQIDQTTSATPNIRITGGMTPSTDSDTNSDNAPFAGIIIEQMHDLAIKIVHTTAEVQILRRFTAAGREHSIAQKFALDGSQCFNPASDGRGDFVSRSEMKKGKLVNSGTSTITVGGPRIEINITEEFSISKNGKKLTIKTLHATPQGIIKLKQEFLRQDEPAPGARITH